ncbi:AbrB family transcriptional regulator [Paenibacillus sp. 2TAB19]|uniref:AbrB family transcriptional regulator n=1 Tax=Paenibacillus sp. 2TAB19 TaxID=3233003 RepID=UPI003F964A53
MIWIKRKNSRFGRFMVTLGAALAGGILFKLLHVPIPWLLGPMIATLIVCNTTKVKLVWPGQLRQAAMITVGYTIGLSLTGSALREMSLQLPTMLLMTALLLLFCAFIALIISKLSHSDYKSALLGSVPGGLSQVILLAEETKGTNLTMVTVTQVIRLMVIVICIPLLAYSPMISHYDAGSSATAETTVTAVVEASTSSAALWSGLFPNLILFAVVGVACAWIGDKIKFPTAYLLGPAIGTAALQFTGVHGPELPSLFVNAAQLMIGVYVGMLLKPQQLEHKVRTLLLAIASGLLMLLCALGLSVLLSKLQSVSEATAMLSLAPGGMDQMGIIAHAINADLSMVAGYQLFRMLFIFFVVPPLIRFVFKVVDKRQSSGI